MIGLNQSIDGGDIPPDLDAGACEKLIRTLWEQLLLHDEIVLASRLLEIAPWKIRGNEAMMEMSRLTGSMMSHMAGGEAYRKMYSDYASGLNGVEAIPIPAPVLHEYSQWPRFSLLEAELKAAEAVGRRLTYLDVGSHDGWLTNRAGLRGHSCFGIEACQAYVNLANRKAAEFNTDARHECNFFMVDPHPQSFPGIYDVVTCFEVYEHVPDPDELVSSLARILKPEGRILLSTPHGSWLRAKQVSYHEKWNDPRPREHVRAPTVGDVTKSAERAGLRVDSIRTSDGEWASPDVPGQSFILMIASRA